MAEETKTQEPEPEAVTVAFEPDPPIVGRTGKCEAGTATPASALAALLEKVKAAEKALDSEARRAAQEKGNPVQEATQTLAPLFEPEKIKALKAAIGEALAETAPVFDAANDVLRLAEKFPSARREEAILRERLREKEQIMQGVGNVEAAVHSYESMDLNAVKNNRPFYLRERLDEAAQVPARLRRLAEHVTSFAERAAQVVAKSHGEVGPPPSPYSPDARWNIGGRPVEPKSQQAETDFNPIR